MNKHFSLRRVGLLLGLLAGLVCPGSALAHGARLSQDQLLTQEIRYHLPEAGEVFLVWGINGWTLVPEETRPAGTVVKNAVMHTPMIHQGDMFVAQVQVPTGTTIDYGFLITKSRSGTYVGIWDGGSGDFHLTPTGDDLIEVTSTVRITPSFKSVLKVVLILLAGIGSLMVFALALEYIPHLQQPRMVVWVLAGLTIGGVALRVWVAWHYNQVSLDTPERLAGDESGYDQLAVSLLQGSFFPWPGRMPLYPMFLAACYALFGHSYAKLLYVQAVIGSMTIPLTFLIARRFNGSKTALLAASLAAIYPPLIVQTTRLYSEIIYTPLLLLAVFVMLWSLEKPRLAPFLIAGFLMALLTLCRPVTLLAPLFLPILMPRAWHLQRRALLALCYTASMLVTMAPWAYHNYRAFGKLMLTTVSSYTVWQASPEYYHLYMDQQLDALTIFDQYIDPNANGGHNPFSVEGSDYFAARGLASIRAEPVTYLWYTAQKPLFFWFGHPANYWEWPLNIEWMFYYLGTWQIAGVASARLLPLAALAGLLILRARCSMYLPLLAVCGYFILVYMPLITEARYSEPLHPLLIIIVVAAARAWRTRYSTKHPAH